jgi:hypothetical protein
MDLSKSPAYANFRTVTPPSIIIQHRTCVREAWERGNPHPMVSIVYGSPATGSPNNWALSSADLADDAAVNAQYLRTGSNNNPPSPLPLSRSMGSPGQTVLRQARPQVVMQ